MECYVCTAAFDGGERLPKVLIPCGHSVCLKCVQQLSDKKCPTCRQAFQGPPEKFPTNFTVLQLLRDLKLRSDKPRRPRGWCFKCGAAAPPKCWAEHDVLAVGAALKRRLEEGVLSRAAGQLRGLQDQVQEEQAVQALTLLGGQSWGLTLRGGDRLFSGTLADAEDPVTQALLLGVVAKAGLTETEVTRSQYEVNCYDLTLSPKAKDRADDLELICGVERLINVDCSHNALREMLQVAAPTVEHLSVEYATPAALRETCTMPRLKRLQVITSCRDFVDNCDADSNAVPLPQLPGGQGRLQWLEVQNPRRALLELLLPAHRLTLEVLQLNSGLYNCQMTCSKLIAVLKLCDMRALRRLVLINVLPKMYNTYKDHQLNKDICPRQRSMLRRVLPAGAEVLCWLCDGEEGAPLSEVF